MLLWCLALALAVAATSQGTPGGPPSASTEVRVELETVLGRIVLAVDVKRAPVTAANFLRNVDAGLYNGARFHRVARVGGPAAAAAGALQSIQAGVDPSKMDDRFDAIPLERTSVTGLAHTAGVVSMARGPRADSARAEFFILLSDYPALDFGGGAYADGQGAAAFGRVVEGLDVAGRIQWQPAADGVLSPPVLIIRASRVP